MIQSKPGRLTPARVPLRPGGDIRIERPEPPGPPHPVVSEFVNTVLAAFTNAAARVAPPPPVEPCDVELPEHIRYIEAPTAYTPLPGERAVVLCGGIPGVLPWHGTAVELFASYPHRLAILCPRRRNFPYNNRDAGRTQVVWEQAHVRPRNGVSLFWFPQSLAAVTVQPSTLLELGWAIGVGQRFVVGAHAGYARRDILEHQLGALDWQVLCTLDDTVAAARALLEDVEPGA